MGHGRAQVIAVTSFKRSALINKRRALISVEPRYECQAAESTRGDQGRARTSFRIEIGGAEIVFRLQSSCIVDFGVAEHGRSADHRRTRMQPQVTDTPCSPATDHEHGRDNDLLRPAGPRP